MIDVPRPPVPSRIAIVTSGDAYGESALTACAAVRVIPDAVLLVGRPAQRPDRRVHQLATRPPRELASSMVARVMAKLVGRWGSEGMASK